MATPLIPITLAWLISLWLVSRIAVPSIALGIATGVAIAGIVLWRRRGLARALIVRSLRAQQAAGMIEPALAADSDSTSGVAHLYEACGFQIDRRTAIYREPV